MPNPKLSWKQHLLGEIVKALKPLSGPEDVFTYAKLLTQGFGRSFHQLPDTKTPITVIENLGDILAEDIHAAYPTPINETLAQRTLSSLQNTVAGALENIADLIRGIPSASTDQLSADDSPLRQNQATGDIPPSLQQALEDKLTSNSAGVFLVQPSDQDARLIIAMKTLDGGLQTINIG